MPKAKSIENTPLDTVAKPKQTRTRKKPEVVAQDRSLWRSSIIPVHHKINKAAAIEEYRLKAADLEGLEFQKKSTTVKAKGTSFTRPMYLYRERDVELRAWEKYGGPAAFEKMLDTKRAKWYQKYGHHSGKIFRQPRFYMPHSTTPAPLVDSLTIQVSPMSATSHSPSFEDSEVQTPALYDMKRTMVRDGKEWLWNRLHCCFHNQESDPWLQDEGRRLEKIITAAMPEFVMKYDPRPPEAEDEKDSPSFHALKEVLGRAAVYDEGLDEQDGLTIWQTWHPEWDVSVDWTKEYYEEVYAALSRIIAEHGVDGWKKARWLVYDRFVECKLGNIYYYQEDIKTGSNFGKWVWEDNAVFWLQAKDYPFNDETKKAAFLVSLSENSPTEG